MNFIFRFFRRLNYRNTVIEDESNNVVDGMVKAKLLYKELSKMAHPDHNIGNEELARDLMSRIVANKHNYSELLLLKDEIEETLLK